MKISQTFQALLLVTSALVFTTSTGLAFVSDSFSVGDSTFGASGEYSITDTSGLTTYKASLTAKAKGTVLRVPVPLGSGTSNLEVDRSGRGRASGSLTLAGIKLASWDKTFASTSDFQTAPLFQTQVGGSERFTIGYVDLKLSVNAEVKIYARGSIVTDWPITARRPKIEAAVGPALDAAASARATFSVIVAKASVGAGLSITGYGLTGRIKIEPIGFFSNLLTASVTADTVATNGSITGYVKVGWGWFSKRWDKTFYSYSQPATSRVLVSITRRM